MTANIHARADMLRGLITGILLTVIVAALCGYGVVRSGWIPVNADATPGRLETWIAGTSLDASLNRLAPRQPNPVELNDANLTEGMTLYKENCTLCHGTAAGEASASAVAKGLYPPPPQLATDGVEDDPEGVTFWKIKHGIRWTAMPSWKSKLDDQQIWKLALFLKHMDKLPSAVQDAWKK